MPLGSLAVVVSEFRNISTRFISRLCSAANAKRRGLAVPIRTLFMKLSAYIISVDSGFAPDPFGHHCTLACCKPTIRSRAEPGDIIVGTAAAHFPHAGRLIYAMHVREVLPYQ